MEPPEFEDSPVAGGDGFQDYCSRADREVEPREVGSLQEIAERLQSDPQECWQALEGLASVELEVRLSIIDELSRQSLTPGAQTLLRLLATARDPTTQKAAALRSRTKRGRGIGASGS